MNIYGYTFFISEQMQWVTWNTHFPSPAIRILCNYQRGATVGSLCDIPKIKFCENMFTLLISRHVGDLGNIHEDEDGKVNQVVVDDSGLVHLEGEYSIIGRAIVVSLDKKRFAVVIKQMHLKKLAIYYVIRLNSPLYEQLTVQKVMVEVGGALTLWFTTKLLGFFYVH